MLNRAVFKKLWVVTLLFTLISSGFIIYGIAGKLRKNGIATITVDTTALPSLLERGRLRLPGLSDIPDLTSDVDSLVSGLSDKPTSISIPDKDAVDNFKSKVGSRISEAASKATSTIQNHLSGIPKKITVGTDHICSVVEDKDPKFQTIPLDISDILHAPLDVPIISSFLNINGHACLIIALAGLIMLGIVTGLTVASEDARFGFSIPVSLRWPRLLMDVVIFLLITTPLLVTVTKVYTLQLLLKAIIIFKVVRGDLTWSLPIILVASMASAVFFLLLRYL
jgi:hypothetical protein